MNTQPTTSPYFDFRDALHENRLLGLWRMMTDFRLSYIAATISLAFSALAKPLSTCYCAFSQMMSLYKKR